jgi:hypothetical protein
MVGAVFGVAGQLVERDEARSFPSIFARWQGEVGPISQGDVALLLYFVLQRLE